MNRKFPPTGRIPASQRGAILVTSMLLLIVLTVLGVTMMRMTNMQERMAGNTRDLNLSLQGAEAALRAGEDRLSPGVLTSRPLATAAVGCVFCARNSLPVAIYDISKFDWKALGQEYGVADTQEIKELSRDPRYVIAELGYVPDGYAQGQDPPTGRDFYQITGFSSGATGQTNTVLQSTFPRRF